MQLRLATIEDKDELNQLIVTSVHGLQSQYYSEQQRLGALGIIFGVDTQLIRDQTFYVVQSEASIIGCGGWSFRKALFGGDSPVRIDLEGSKLNPDSEPARIRAFFVHPKHARKGIATAILDASEAALVKASFRKAQLVATLSGVPFYAARGYHAVRNSEIKLVNGDRLPVVDMEREF